MKRETMLKGLMAIAFMVIISGLSFSIYGLINNVTFKLMGSNFPGFIIGGVAVFLGVRYVKSVKKLEKKLSETNAEFSWNNFRKSHS